VAPEVQLIPSKETMRQSGRLRKASLQTASLCGLLVFLPWTDGEPPQTAAADGYQQIHAAELLAARERGPTPLLDDLRELCDGIGGRPTGSKACDRAVDWAVERFRAAGVASVWTETYTVPGSWVGGADHGLCVAPVEFPIRVAAGPFTAPTPGGRPLEAPLVNAGDGSAESFAQLGEKARGAVALVLSHEIKTVSDLFAEYGRDGPMFAAAQRAGVAALLVQSSHPGVLLYRHPMGWGTNVLPIPAAIVARVHAARLARLALEGGVRVRLDLPSRVGGAYQARNVVAEIQGRERTPEIVLIGAHLDSWDLGTGAEDNGVNAAMIIDIARSFEALRVVPRRTVRFALFTGEEQGMYGSEAYVLRHAREMANHVAMITFDTGSGRTTGFYLNGRDDLRQPVNRALAAVPGLAATDDSLEAIDGTDNFDFLISGVPNLIARQEWTPYLPNYHAETDVYDAVNPSEAKNNAALAAALIWGLAESPDRPAPHQTRAEVAKLLHQTRLDEQMKSAGQWDDWVAGRRGVNQ
jgi:carboxypeptidase Q